MYTHTPSPITPSPSLTTLHPPLNPLLPHPSTCYHLPVCAHFHHLSPPLSPSPTHLTLPLSHPSLLTPSSATPLPTLSPVTPLPSLSPPHTLPYHTSPSLLATPLTSLAMPGECVTRGLFGMDGRWLAGIVGRGKGIRDSPPGSCGRAGCLLGV